MKDGEALAERKGPMVMAEAGTPGSVQSWQGVTDEVLHRVSCDSATVLEVVTITGRLMNMQLPSWRVNLVRPHCQAGVAGV